MGAIADLETLATDWIAGYLAAQKTKRLSVLYVVLATSVVLTCVRERVACQHT